MSDTKTKVDNIVGEYQFGFITDSTPIMSTGKGISEAIVRQISAIKKEPQWMTDYRVESYHNFVNTPNPNWGPDLSFIDFKNLHTILNQLNKQ